MSTSLPSPCQPGANAAAHAAATGAGAGMRPPQRHGADLCADLALSAVAAEPAAGDDEAAGHACGWFESSWVLQQGLQVSELPDSDGVVAALWFGGRLAPNPAGSARLQ